MRNVVADVRRQMKPPIPKLAELREAVGALDWAGMRRDHIDPRVLGAQRGGRSMKQAIGKTPDGWEVDRHGQA